jgi:hypothetical protein
MIPVVMEDRVRNTGTWDGEVGLGLGGRLYVDMCGDVWDDDYAENCIDDLYSKIIKIIKTPIKGLSTDPSSIQTQEKTAETMPDQVRPSPKKKPLNRKPLKQLSVDDVSTLLESVKLGKFVDEMRENDVDGETLYEVKDDDELKELGISLGVKARMFYNKIEEYKFQGVPFDLLGIEIKQEVKSNNVQPTVSKHVTKYGDGKFTISGATGGCSGRINGTFEISEEMQNGLPIYSKVGDDETFIELCFGYYQCKDEDMLLPSQTDNSAWFIFADQVFATQSTVVITPSDTLPLPTNISQLLAQARTTIREAKEALVSEVRY